MGYHKKLVFHADITHKHLPTSERIQLHVILRAKNPKLSRADKKKRSGRKKYLERPHYKLTLKVSWYFL